MSIVRDQAEEHFPFDGRDPNLVIALRDAYRRGLTDAVMGMTTRSPRHDDQPCPRCGGDRLRSDFTGSGRCHAPRAGTESSDPGSVS